MDTAPHEQRSAVRMPGPLSCILVEGRGKFLGRGDQGGGGREGRAARVQGSRLGRLWREDLYGLWLRGLVGWGWWQFQNKILSCYEWYHMISLCA